MQLSAEATAVAMSAPELGIGIDWVRIESQARSAGITDLGSQAYLLFAYDRYMPMLANLEEQWLDASAGLDTGAPETDLPAKDAREAIDEMGAEIDRTGRIVVVCLRAHRATDRGRERQRHECRDRNDAPTCATELNHGIPLLVPFPKSA